MAYVYGNHRRGFENAERALKYKLASLKLCEELNDDLGFCSEWLNFATFATGAGLYRDAVQYATVALEAKVDGGTDWVTIRSTAFLSRANVLIRLGRLAEAKSDLASAYRASPTLPALQFVTR